MHNFPDSFDDVIFNEGDRTLITDFWRVDRPGLSNDSAHYTLEGSINGRDGIYEIFTRPSNTGQTEVINHRFFRPSE